MPGTSSTHRSSVTTAPIREATSGRWMRRDGAETGKRTALEPYPAGPTRTGRGPAVGPRPASACAARVAPPEGAAAHATGAPFREPPVPTRPRTQGVGAKLAP